VLVIDDSIVSAIEESIALNKELGIQVAHLEVGNCQVRTDVSPLHLNHNGTMHAGVLFMLAEFSAGLAVLSNFFDVIEKMYFVVQKGSIEFLSSAKGATMAEGHVENKEEAFANGRRSLEQGEKAEIPVSVSLQDEASKKEVARASFTVVLKPMK